MQHHQKGRYQIDDTRFREKDKSILSIRRRPFPLVPSPHRRGRTGKDSPVSKDRRHELLKGVPTSTPLDVDLRRADPTWPYVDPDPARLDMNYSEN